MCHRKGGCGKGGGWDDRELGRGMASSVDGWNGEQLRGMRAGDIGGCSGIRLIIDGSRFEDGGKIGEAY